MENKLDTSKDNTTEEIKQVVETEFNNIETFSWDDDEEIYTAWLAICEKYTDDLKWENSRALEPFEKLKAELNDKVKEIQGLGWFDSLTLDQKQEIHEVAQKIDNAENEVLKRLRLTRAKQSSADIVQNAQESQWDKAVFEMEKDDQGNDTGVLVFTKAADPITIHQALKNLSLDPEQKYIIDYSQCDMTGLSQRVKEKMTSLIWIGTCYIFYDDSKKTFVVRDKDGNPVEDRVLICKKARLIPDGIKQFEAQQKIQTQNENLGTFDIDENSDQSPEKDPQFKDMIAQIPSGLRSKLQSLDNKEYRKFIIATENRLATLLRDAKSQSYELSTEPITKTRFTSGLMELHLVAWDNEKNITIWNSDNHWELWDNLYDILDDNDFESDYKSYLTDRVEAKRAEFEWLTKNQLLNLNTKEWENWIDDTARSNILNGLKLWNTTIENYKNGEWDSWLDNDDKKLVAMMQLIRDAQYTLEKNNPTSLEAITNTIITPLRDKWVDFNYETPLWTKNHQQTFQKIFLWKPEQQINAIRETCKRVTIIDNTETSHLANEIAMENIELNDTTLNDYFQNIKNKLEIKEDDPEAAKKKALIDDLYDKAKNDKDWTDILGFLTSDEVKLLPKSWATDPDVKKKALEIWRTLRKNQEKMDALTENAIMKRQEKLRLELEAKTDKTEEDIVMLQGLTFLSQNPDIAQEEYAKIMEKEKDGIKYWGINELFMKSFITTFVDKADGVKGTNADILNDIVGVGRLDLSDENAKFAWELLVDIAITIAVSLLTAWTWAVVMGWILRVGSGIAKWLKATKLLQKIEKTIQTLSKLKSTKTLKQTFNVYKNATLWEKVTLLGITASEKALEAPIFNAALATFNAAIHGTSLDSLNLYPLAKENLKTAAFLWALSLWNKLWMGMIGKLHGAHKLVAFSKAWLNDVLKNYKWMWTESLISEATAMFGAEQGMNFVFWNDVINPVTWEVETTRSLQRPTEGERVQMIGMILAFKAFKPQLWAKYERKLNDGTLQVCRSTNKNEVLLRDPITWKTENIQDLIDNKNNNNITQEAREARQRKNISYFDHAWWMIRLRKAKNLPDALKKFADANNDYKKLTIDDIKNLQREIGLTWDAVDGIVWSTTVEQLKRYLNSENFGKLHTQAVQQEAEMNRKKTEIEELNWKLQTNETTYLSNETELQKKKELLEQKKDELQELQKQREKVKKEWWDIDIYKNWIDTEIAKAKQAIDNLQNEISKSEKTLVELQKEYQKLQNKVDILQTLVDHNTWKLNTLNEQLKQVQTPKNVVNRETLAKKLSEQRWETNNANEKSMTFDINENYTGEIKSWNSWKNLIIKNTDGSIYKEIECSPAQKYRDIINANLRSDNPNKVTEYGEKLLREKDAELAETIALELPDSAIDFSIREGENKRVWEATKPEAEAMQKNHQNLELYKMQDWSWWLRQKTQTETQLQQQIEQIQTNLTQQQNTLNDKKTELEQKTTELESQRTTLSSQKKALVWREADIQNLQTRANLNKKIDAKKNEIADLTRDINAESHQWETIYTSAKKELETQLNEAKRALEQAQQNLENTKKAIDKLSIWLPEGDRIISLRNKIKALQEELSRLVAEESTAWPENIYEAEARTKRIEEIEKQINDINEEIKKTNEVQANSVELNETPEKNSSSESLQQKTPEEMELYRKFDDKIISKEGVEIAWLNYKINLEASKDGKYKLTVTPKNENTPREQDVTNKQLQELNELFFIEQKISTMKDRTLKDRNRAYEIEDYLNRQDLTFNVQSKKVKDLYNQAKEKYWKSKQQGLDLPEERAALSQRITEAKNKTLNEREKVTDEAINHGKTDVKNAEKEQKAKWTLSDQTKKNLKDTQKNLENAEKLTKDTKKVNILKRLLYKIKELLNRNGYGEFMKYLRSKEGLTINEAKYKIIEKEGKKFIQMTDKNWKEIWDPMEMNYKNLDELHKEYLQDKKATELHQKNMSGLEAIKQKTAKELAEAKQTYIKAAENLKRRFPDYKQFEEFKKILESKTTLEDTNKVRDSFSKALINTLKPWDTVTLSRTIMWTTDYIVAKDSKGNLTFTHAKEKLSVKDLQDIMKKEEIEIKRKAERSDSESVKDKKWETLSETGDDIISNAWKEQQAINWDKSDYGFVSYKISEVDQILNEKWIPHFNTLNKEWTGYMAFETSNWLELIIYEKWQATYRIVWWSTYDITWKYIPSTSLKQVLEGHQLQFISASEDWKTPNFIDVSKSPYKEQFKNIKKNFSQTSLRISNEHPETSEVSFTEEELQKQKSGLEQQLKSLEDLWEKNRSQLLNLKTIFLEKFLKKGNIITINQLKYQYNGIINNKAVFTIDSKSKKSSNLWNKFPQETITVSSLAEFLDPRFNLEPGNKNNNSSRNINLRVLIDQQKNEEAWLIQLWKNYTDEYFKILTQLNNINQQLQNFETVKFNQGIIERAA